MAYFGDRYFSSNVQVPIQIPIQTPAEFFSMVKALLDTADYICHQQELSGDVTARFSTAIKNAERWIDVARRALSG